MVQIPTKRKGDRIVGKDEEYEEPIRYEGRFSKEVPGMGIDFDAMTVSMELASNIKLDFSPRERKKYAATIRAAGRVMEMLAEALENDYDQPAIYSASLLNLFIAGPWMDFQGAIHENVEREGAKMQRVEEQVRGTRIPDSPEGLEGLK